MEVSIARLRARHTVAVFRKEMSRKSSLQILLDMRHLLNSPARWSQWSSARMGANGYPCDPCDPCANRWDLAGAMHKAAGDEDSLVAKHDVICLLSRLARMPLVFFNDQSTHEQVLELLDRAIEAERASSL